MTLALLVQRSAEQAATTAASTTTSLLILAVVLVLIVAMWKVFERAGEPGWAAIIPIYNLIVMMRIAGMSAWWILAALIPLVNIIFHFKVSIGIANRFDKGTGFGIGLALLPFIFYPLLAWGDSAPAPRTA